MARAGIYVNGKEIVARYVGDKLVWKKGVDFPYLAETVTLRPNNPIAQIKFANWSEFQEFEIVTRRSSDPNIRMFIEE